MMLFPYGCHRSPKYFSEPEKFIPERFENWAGKLPFAYTPFSAGPRNCIGKFFVSADVRAFFQLEVLGQKFAGLEMLATLSKIIRKFKLAPAKPEHRMQMAAETILISKNGVKISLEKR